MHPYVLVFTFEPQRKDYARLKLEVDITASVHLHNQISLTESEIILPSKGVLI